jgi:putative Mn2+ efflux pump MntP
MESIFVGSLIISMLHALIPNHWLPVLAIGKKEGWNLSETSRITFLGGMAHVISTVIIGILIGVIGKELAENIKDFTQIIAPLILILIGLYFIRQHYRHHHFHLRKEEITKKTKRSIVVALTMAMFLSPCMEIEAYFLLAGAMGWQMIALVATMYALISIAGMLIWVRIVYKRLLKLNWHRWEHNAGIITGLTMVATGLFAFFIS